ncbi:fad fmn-binding family protein [Stylonychia lemnae]|uniref:Fad fmn-binding family protein n=1 Tax=Stylonychia lemnae TaxID=5949 RepID=A0A078A7P4_STYLE|nr:fad fmn-binding family protein [Stylonychia lemnae]|eukprot:CDW78264.1 fad fmn-binding family protein [Stylonychia lemnae]
MNKTIKTALTQIANKRPFGTYANGVQPVLTTAKVGDVNLKNRVVMSALTRQKAPREGSNRGVPSELHQEYYSSRAEDAGFVLTECSSVSEDGDSFPGSTGIYNDQQVEGWKKVTEAVHSKDGRIFLQIWHAGRAAHPDQIGGRTPISSSAIAIDSKVWAGGKLQPHVVPKEATLDDIKRVIEAFRAGAERAKQAGFDGVELHGANGYFIDQFLRDGVNKRTDNYGGSLENRSRLCFEVLDQLISVFGSQRVGVKLSPVNDYNKMEDSDPIALVSHLIPKLNERKLGFVELTEGFSLEGRDAALRKKFYENRTEKSFREIFKRQFDGTYITNHGMTQDSANETIQKGHTDLVSFGQLYVANRDLVHKFRTGAPLNKMQFADPKQLMAYLYGELGALGYTDTSVYEPKQK